MSMADITSSDSAIAPTSNQKVSAMHEATTPVPVETRAHPIQTRSAATSTQVQSRPSAREDEDSVGSEGYRAIDRMRESLSAEATGGLSSGTLAPAVFDWSIHLSAMTPRISEISVFSFTSKVLALTVRRKLDGTRRKSPEPMATKAGKAAQAQFTSKVPAFLAPNSPFVQNPS